MSIASEITRLTNAKAAIKTAIQNKGVTVSSSAKIDTYAALIGNIPQATVHSIYIDDVLMASAAADSCFDFIIDKVSETSPPMVSGADIYYVSEGYRYSTSIWMVNISVGSTDVYISTDSV